MIVSVTHMIIAQALIIGGIIWTTPDPCPRKYRVTQEKGGILASPSDIFRYCKLDYGGKFVLRDEYKENDDD